MHPSLPFVICFNIVCLFNLNFLTFSHPFSPSKHKLTLYGDAFFLNNTISLTHHQPPCLSSSSSSSSQAKSSAVGIGRALYLYPVKFLEPSSNTTASFSCRFSFSIIASSDSCPFGDGFAFLITSNADSFAFSNGFMGLPDPTTLNPQDSFIAVEFDTGFNPAHGDINDNHIGIDLNSLVSFASVDAISKGIDLKSGREMMAWIEYTDVLKLFRVWVGFSAVKPARPVLATQIDLSEKFKEYMHVGFSASNGASGSALHIIKRWKFRTFGSYQDSIQEEEQDEDCLVCSSEDSRNSSNSRKIHSKGLKFRVSVLGLQLPFLNLLLVLAAIAIFSSFILFSLIRGTRVNQNPVNQEEEGEEDKEEDRNSAVNRMPGRLSLAEIKSATMGFHENKKIGQGASATVYKGSIPSVGPVAVKRFDRGTWPHCNRNPFATEFTTMTGYLRHKNLVQFQGWCCEGTETALVFEYLPNGSLDNFLHKKPDSESLSWYQRVNIMLGVASALTYLHEECERQIIHRDVKCCNIMLDSDFNAKLGDFGLAEVYEHSSIVAGRNSTIPAGTMGYLAPEYVYSGVPSEKSDVYSFGIVVLEICSGHRPVEEDGTVLVEWIWSLWEKGKVVEAADMRLRGEFDAAEMERVVMVGMVCAHPNSEERPSVKEAARIIRGEAPPPVLPARRPTFRIRSVAVMPEEGEEVGRCDYHGDVSPSVEDFPWMTPRSQFS